MNQLLETQANFKHSVKRPEHACANNSDLILPFAALHEVIHDKWGSAVPMATKDKLLFNVNMQYLFAIGPRERARER